MGRPTPRTLLAACLAAWAACGGSSKDAIEPAGAGSDGGVEGGAADENSCSEAFDEYVQAWTRWFVVEVEDEEVVEEMVAAFREELPEREELKEMREVAVELRYEPGFERWLVALDATEYAIEICGEGASEPRG